MHALSTSQIAEILHFNDKESNHCLDSTTKYQMKFIFNFLLLFSFFFYIDEHKYITWYLSIYASLGW